MKNKERSPDQNLRKTSPAGKNAAPEKRKSDQVYQNQNPVKPSTGSGVSSSKRNMTQNGISGLRDLFESQLQDIYFTEKAVKKAMPGMIQKATSGELADALSLHLNATAQHIARCEEVFASMNLPATTKKCEAIEGLLKEAKEIMETTEEGSVRDAGIIAAAQKVEHYEIASYGTLAAFARQLGALRAASLLEDTLAEEKQTDQILTEIAETHINEEAERVYH